MPDGGIKKIFSVELLIIPLFFSISFFISLPLLRDLYSSCRGDWDYFFSLYEVPLISLFKYHQFPLWNPYFGGGMPLIGNPQAGYLSPVLVLTALFGAVAGLKIAVWLHTFLGLWGMWLLGGYLGINGPARFAPPCVFMFTSAWALHLAEGHIVWLPAALIPFLFLTFLKGLDSRAWLVFAAVIESIMFYEGGTYILAFTILFMVVYTAALAFMTRRFQPLAAFALVNIVAALLSAPKLLPVMELLVRNPRATGSGAGLSLNDFLMLIVDRSQSFFTTFHGHGWWEYGAYLGIPGIALYTLGLVRFREHGPLVLASFFMLLLTLGNFAAWAPWNILHNLPIFSFLKVPTRALIVFMFSAALMIGLALEKIRQTGDKHAAAMVAVLVVMLAADLFSVSYRIFAEAPRPSSMFYGKLQQKQTLDGVKPYRIAPSASSGLWNSVASLHNPFTQTSVPLSRRNAHGGWSDQYLHLLQNRGVVDAYETIPFSRYALAVTHANYRGEWYFLGKGTATLLSWSPNRLTFRVTAHENGRLVINQNFWNGWRTTDGILRPFNGLLSVDLGKGDHTISLRYLPTSFLAGVWLLTGTLILMVIACCSSSARRHGTLSSAAGTGGKTIEHLES